MTKFNVGDKVRIVRQVSKDCTACALIGGTAVILGPLDSDGHYPCEYENNFGGTNRGWITPRSIEPIDRLTEAEAKIATLEAEVKALKKSSVTTNITVNADSQTFDSHVFASKMADALGVTRKPTRTPNSRRADVIKRAQAFVADIIGAYPNFTTTIGRFDNQAVVATFHVNAEKRTVVALVHGYFSRKLAFKAIAKCAPDDVFNADIGKAIALGRALGVKVPKEFTDAPKPTEVVVGMRVKYVGSVSDRFGDIDTVHPPGQYENRGGKCAIDSIFARNSVIVDDTDAVYE